MKCKHPGRPSRFISQDPIGLSGRIKEDSLSFRSAKDSGCVLRGNTGAPDGCHWWAAAMDQTRTSHLMQSLLLCIVQSIDDSAHPSTGPYYPDVVGLAAELAGRRAATIDELLLAGRLPAVKQAEDWNGHTNPDASEWGLI